MLGLLSSRQLPVPSLSSPTVDPLTVAAAATARPSVPATFRWD